MQVFDKLCLTRLWSLQEIECLINAPQNALDIASKPVTQHINGQQEDNSEYFNDVRLIQHSVHQTYLSNCPLMQFFTTKAGQKLNILSRSFNFSGLTSCNPQTQQAFSKLSYLSRAKSLLMKIYSQVTEKAKRFRLSTADLHFLLVHF